MEHSQKQHWMCQDALMIKTEDGSAFDPWLEAIQEIMLQNRYTTVQFQMN